MKKKLTIPEVMTAKQVANLLHRITRFRWGKSYLFNPNTVTHCALGQIARVAGVKDETLASIAATDGYVEYSACEPVYYSNDLSDTKEQVVQRLCDLGDKPIPVGRFITRLLARQKERGL